MSNVAIMVPIAITAGMIKTGTTIPEVATDETAWVSGSNYVPDDLRTSAGSVWLCWKAATGRTVPPENDPGYWLRKGPTLRQAPFDDYRTTSATATGELKYVIQPGFFNGVWVDNPKGARCSIVVKAAPGGAVIRDVDRDLFQQAAGFGELLFAPLPALEHIDIDGLSISPNAEVTITITAPDSGPVSVGDIKIGDWRHLVPAGEPGGVRGGAKSRQKSYSSIKENEDGTYYRVRRPSARTVTANVVFLGDNAVYADAILREVADVAVPFRASGLPKFSYLNTLAFLDGEISADDNAIASLSLTAKGTV